MAARQCSSAPDPWPLPLTSGLKGHALLRDCLRHRELVLRPTVFAELAPAREALLGQMEAQLEAQREDFEARHRYLVITPL